MLYDFKILYVREVQIGHQKHLGVKWASLIQLLILMRMCICVQLGVDPKKIPKTHMLKNRFNNVLKNYTIVNWSIQFRDEGGYMIRS